MMNKKIGFIGSGHIAGILAHNFIKRLGIPSQNICVSDPDRSKSEALASRFGVCALDSNVDIVKQADYIFICVHPVAVTNIIGDVRSQNLTGKTLISVTAGTPTRLYRKALGDCFVTRILPNPPSSLGEGAIPIVIDERMPEPEKTDVLQLISSLGKSFPVSEEKIDIFTSVTSPAPVLSFFEAMIEAAVYCGLDHSTASSMVKQTIKGCLALCETGDREISSLIIEACTPGGTSVESLRTMDKGAFRSTVKEAYIDAYEKSRSLGKDKS